MIALQQQELMFRMEVMQVDKRKPATGFLAVFSQFQLSSLKRSFNSANGNGSNPWKHWFTEGSSLKICNMAVDIFRSPTSTDVRHSGEVFYLKCYRRLATIGRKRTPTWHFFGDGLLNTKGAARAFSHVRFVAGVHIQVHSGCQKCDTRGRLIGKAHTFTLKRCHIWYYIKSQRRCSVVKSVTLVEVNFIRGAISGVTSKTRDTCELLID